MDKKYSLATRSYAGHANFFLMNFGVSLAPLSLTMVCWQTNPFWISIIALIWLKEPIMKLELLGMAICFAMVGIIAFQAKQDDDKAADEEENEYKH